jgi:hypothetical protein
MNFIVSVLLEMCHPERQQRVSFIVVEILRFAQNDTQGEDL